MHENVDSHSYGAFLRSSARFASFAVDDTALSLSAMMDAYARATDFDASGSRFSPRSCTSIALVAINPMRRSVASAVELMPSVGSGARKGKASVLNSVALN